MRVVYLCGYISLVLGLSFVFASLITYAPGAEGFGIMMQSVSGFGALGSGGLAIVLSRLPRDHWVHQSRAVWLIFVTAAVTITIFVLVGVIG